MVGFVTGMYSVGISRCECSEGWSVWWECVVGFVSGMYSVGVSRSECM